jgi:tRNA1Val (adenine37-N6)-methyltransferase
MNTFFQFKQFTIHQNKCAMKVCTDACLFGAWVAEKITTKEITPQKILDIGTGTGLLSLMLAQKTNCPIDTVEINQDAFEQATSNVAQSAWKNKITLMHDDILHFIANEKYDFIICNPPFFENQLKSNKEDRNAAMHATSLSFENLLQAIKNNLSANGLAAVLLPYDKISYFESKLTAANLFIVERLNVSHSPTHDFFRSILLISPIVKEEKLSQIAIKDNSSLYTEEFSQLLKDYYLHF